MPRNADRILTTHVGSLIRPPKLIEFWRAIEDGKPYDEAAFEACLTESVAEVVRQQAEAGIDIVSDGEFSKGAQLGVLHLQAAQRHRRAGGDAGGTERPDGLDVAAAGTARHFRNSMPSTTSRPASANGSATASSSTGRSATRGQTRSGATSRTSRPASPRPSGNTRRSPASCRWWRRRARCPAPRSSTTRTRRAYLFALADALHQEYKAIVDAGLYVQIDDAFLPYMHERMVPPMSNARLPALGAAAHRRAQSRARAASRRSARAITSAGAAGTARTPSTCR